MTEVAGAALSTPRFTSALLSMFALLALMLSAVGIYGVLSYVVMLRATRVDPVIALKSE
jgi:ABC-type antimicrobial peptide transport system permease subunit